MSGFLNRDKGTTVPIGGQVYTWKERFSLGVRFLRDFPIRARMEIHYLSH